ncbi:MAG: 16S rRNA (guanine(966)-N(2))-methyltransferase RsmD [Fibrobacter sp.]|nr:16S rRNA (guanine(966)-N(2))-methyltransferase RsmD [Fibrobacter sp.]
MKFRIISGEFRGRVLHAPDCGKAFRPTLERTRESVSEIIKNIVDGARAADLCSGSGAFGFEMLSRGASKVDFVEKDRKRFDYIKKNAEILGITNQCSFFNSDVNRFIRNSGGGYDIIYYDPPYSLQELQNLVPDILQLLSPDGILIHEHSSVSGNETGAELIAYDTRSYGNTIIDFYKRNFQ